MIDALKNRKIIISTHSLAYSAPQALRDYVKQQKFNKLLFISHPLSVEDLTNNDFSKAEIIHKGKIIKVKKSQVKINNFSINCLYEFFLTLKWVVQEKEKYDLFVGVDCLNTFFGLVLRLLNKVDKVVFYTIDYFPVRFENKIINWIYFLFDKVAVKKADETWNVSSMMVKAREKNNVKEKKQFTVPIGVWFDKAPRKSFEAIDKNTLFFTGHLKEYMGLDLAIRALAIIRKTIPNIKLKIIGQGEAEVSLRKLVNDLDLKKNVFFLGWISDRKKLEEIMSYGAVGIAPFNTRILDEKIKNADPAKLKDYMLLGMPVIVTNAINNIDEIKQNKCGIVIKYSLRDFTEATIKILKNQDLLKQYRKNALDLIKHYDYNTIFLKNLNRTFNEESN